MKLIRLYIAGFGNLQDYSYEFGDGINVITAPNGWGKSTFAAFLRSMFYGLGDTRARSIAENPRKRYAPWTGGAFGGNLEIEIDGKQYRIERFFGAKESGDTFTLYDLDTGKTSDAYSSMIGEELFGIDADGFSRTVFMDASAHVHGKEDKSVNNSINTKLNDLLQAENDLGNYEHAMEALLRRKRYYKTTGERGEIYAGERRLTELQRQIEVCLAQKQQAKQLDEQIANLTPAVQQSEQQMQQLQKDLSSAVSRKQRRTVLENYSKMRSEVSAAKREAEAIAQQFEKEVPDAKEAENCQLLIGQLTTLQGRAQQMQSDNSIKEALTGLQPTFANGVTPLSEIDEALKTCNELRVLENEVHKHNALAQSLQDQADAIGDPVLPKPGKQGKRATAGSVFGIVLAVLSVVLLITAAILLLNSRVLFGILSGIGGVALLGLAVVVLLRAISAAQLSGRSKRAADAAFKIETKKRLLEERESELAEAKRCRDRYHEKAATPIALAQKHALNVENGYITALSTLRHTTEQYLRLLNQQKAKDALYEGIVKEAEQTWAQISRFLRCWNRPFDQSNCATVLAELRTTISDLQRRRQEIAQKEEATHLYAVENRVRELVESGEKDEGELPDPDVISIQWELARTQYQEQSAQLSALVQKAETLYEAADAYGTLVAQKQALTDLLQIQNANYTAISLAEEYMSKARETLSSRYLGKMRDAFTERMQQMGGDQLRFTMNTDFGIMLMEKGKSRSIEYLSSGWRDMVGFCLRLSLADGLFESEKPCLVLDDPFVYLDNERTQAAHRLLDALAEEYQIIYLTCKE